MAKFKSDLREKSRFEVLAPIGSYVNENEKKIVKKYKHKISKIQNSILAWATENKLQKKFEKIQKLFKGRVEF